MYSLTNNQYHPTPGLDWEDPDDPTVIAENELIGAAKSIDAAARKLMSLRPHRVETKVSIFFTVCDVLLCTCCSYEAFISGKG